MSFLCTNSTIELVKLQEEHFTKTKIYSEFTATIYKELKNKKCYKVNDCGTFLIFKNYFTINKLKLAKANFCKVRLCPMCILRKSAKVRANLLKVLTMATVENKYMLLHLVLTVKNCSNKNLKNTIDNILKAFKLFVNRDIFRGKGKGSKNIIKGFFRNLEITYNFKEDTWHPHIHVVLAVERNYFTSSDYITQNEFCEIWKSCLKINYKPVCYIEKCYFIDETGNKIKTLDSINKVVFEASKYISKSSDYLKTDNIELSKKNLFYLDNSLNGRKLFSYGGELLKIKKDLNLEDEEKSNLIYINDEQINLELLEYVYEFYKWDKQDKDYFLDKCMTKEEYKKHYD